MLRKIMYAVLVCAMLMVVPSAFAAIENAAVENGTADSTVITNAGGNVSVYGGNVTEVNVTTNTITQSWAGFFGEVSGGIVLGNSAGDSFYEWTIGDVSGAVVYAANGTTSFGAVAAAVHTNFPDYLTSSAADNFSNTFNETDLSWTDSAEIGAVANVPYVQTWQGGSLGTFRTHALYDSTDDAYILAGTAQADATSFDGGTTDFQILAPADTAGQTYFFYLELP